MKLLAMRFARQPSAGRRRDGPQTITMSAIIVRPTGCVGTAIVGPTPKLYCWQNAELSTMLLGRGVAFDVTKLAPQPSLWATPIIDSPRRAIWSHPTSVSGQSEGTRSRFSPRHDRPESHGRVSRYCHCCGQVSLTA
jgi:hypothetical protein